MPALCQHDDIARATGSQQGWPMSDEFKTDQVFEALKSPLALVEDTEKRQAFERYVEAARYPLERAIFDLLSEAVAAVDKRVSEHYRVRLSYRPGALSLDVEPQPGAPGR
jgi:hypothetical protein